MKKVIALFCVSFLGCWSVEAAQSWFDEFNEAMINVNGIRLQQLQQDAASISNLTSDQIEQLILTSIDRIHTIAFNWLMQEQNMIAQLNGDQWTRVILGTIPKTRLIYFNVLFHNEMIASQISDDQWIQIVSLAASIEYQEQIVDQLLRSDRVLRAIIRNEQTSGGGVKATKNMLGEYYNDDIGKNLAYMRDAMNGLKQLQEAIAKQKSLKKELDAANKSKEEEKNLKEQSTEVNQEISKLIDMLIKYCREALSRNFYIFANELFVALPGDQRNRIKIHINENWAQRFFDITRFGNGTSTIGNHMVLQFFEIINNPNESAPYNPIDAIRAAHTLFSDNHDSFVVALLRHGAPIEIVKYIMMNLGESANEMFTGTSLNGESTIDAAFMVDNLDIVHLMHTHGAVPTWRSFYYTALYADPFTAFDWLHENFQNMGAGEIRQAIAEANRLQAQEEKLGNANEAAMNIVAAQNLYRYLRESFSQDFTVDDTNEADKITEKLRKLCEQ